MQRDTQWRSLGYIAKHLYLEKAARRRRLTTYGPTPAQSVWTTLIKSDATFFIEKDEDFALPLTVRVDGQPLSLPEIGNAAGPAVA